MYKFKEGDYVRVIRKDIARFVGTDIYNEIGQVKEISRYRLSPMDADIFIFLEGREKMYTVHPFEIELIKSYGTKLWKAMND